MKKLSFIIAATVVLFSGCTKNYYGDEFTNPSYRVDGVTDFSISEDNPQFNLNLSLVYMNSEQENVNVTVEGLPGGIYPTYYNNSGIPSFEAYIQFYDSSAVPGTYEAKLVTKGSITGKKTYPFIITVKAPVDCKNDLTGSYAAQNFCSSGSSSFAETISASPTVPKRILIDNFENSGFQIYANLNCNTGQLIVPSQFVNGATYAGSGYFYTTSSGGRSVYFSYYKTFSGGGTTSCNVTLTR
jgi:hypothetical protein